MLSFKRKNLRMQVIKFVSISLFVVGSTSLADTFTNPQTDEILHGYATSKTENGKTLVQTKQKGLTPLNLNQWKVTPDSIGRNNEVVVFSLDNQISLELEAKAFADALNKAADNGPLFALLEIDTPGGRIDLAQKICATITETTNCKVITFVTGGKYGGAISAGAAVAFACNKIYMAKDSSIGAATAIAISSSGKAVDLKDVYGEDVGEKFSSFWQSYLASLAQRNERPGVLARAMINKDIEAIEIIDGDKRVFIEPINKKTQQKVIHTWSKKGSLLTLTASEAVGCKIADKIMNSRADVLKHLDAAKAKIVINNGIQQARRTFRRAQLRADSLKKSIDLKAKELSLTNSAPNALRILREVRSSYKSLIKLAKRFPDLHINIHSMEEQLNSAEAIYKNIKIRSKRRR